MKNAEIIRKRLDEIKKMDDYHQALSALADIQYEIGIDACGERHELQREIENLRKVIIGNGDPSHSIVARLSDVEKCMGDIGKNVEDILTALTGNIKEGDGGLIGKVKTCTQFSENAKKIMWVIIGAALTQIIATIIGLL